MNTLLLDNNPSCLNKITTKVTALYGTVNQTLSVTEKYKAVDSFYYYIRLYSDGTQASYLDNAGQPFYGTNGSHLQVNIPQYNESWAGEYTVVHYANCHYVVNTLLQNCNSHYYLCHDIRIDPILESILQVPITTLGKTCNKLTKDNNKFYTEKPLLEIQADYTVVQRGGTVTLKCSAEGGNPMDYTVQWMKDDQQLASTTSVPAVLLYTSPHYQQQFGVFTCSAINQYYHINKTVLIQERGKD